MTFNPPKLTDDQLERQHIFTDLRKCVMGAFKERHFNINVHTEPLWIHFTDWYGEYDLERLIKQGFIEYDLILRYQPDGTWQDHFPPIAYRLTEKGVAVYDHPAPYIYDGKTEAK